MIRNKITLQMFIALVCLPIILIACSQPEPISQVTPVPEGVEIINIDEGQVITSEISQQKVFDQCESSSSFKAEIRFSQSSGQELQNDLVFKGNVSSEIGLSEIAKVQLGSAIEKRFTNRSTSGQSHDEGVAIEVPAHTKQEYTIVWQEIRRDGEVEYIEDGETYTANYSYRIGVELSSSTVVDLDCSGQETPKITNPTPTQISEPPPTSIIQPTSQPTIQDNSCPPIGDPDAIFSGSLTLLGDTIPAVGTGVFSNAVRPPGTKPSEYKYVRNALTNLCVQIISPGALVDSSSDRQCTTSNYTTNRLWVGTALAGTSLDVRKANDLEFVTIGRIDIPPPDARSYLIEYSLEVEDEICIVAPIGTTIGKLREDGGYHMFWGRDLQAFTDSWCILLEDDGSQHYCN